MPTPTSTPESTAAVLRVPTPTRPVAGRKISADAPDFEWTPIPDAQQYRVQLAASDAFDEIYFEDTVPRGSSIPLSSVLPEGVGSVSWRVRAERSDGTSSHWSGPAHFRRPGVDRESEDTPVRVEAEPVPLRPTDADDRPVDPGAVRFSWEGVPEASGYQVQVADSADFTTPILDVSVDQTKSVDLYDALPAHTTTLFWRVRSLFPTAEPGPWSPPTQFGVATPSTASEPLVPENEDAKKYARASGPVLQGRTSRGFSLIVPLLAVATFIATLLLIATAG